MKKLKPRLACFVFFGALLTGCGLGKDDVDRLASECRENGGTLSFSITVYPLFQSATVGCAKGPKSS